MSAVGEKPLTEDEKAMLNEAAGKLSPSTALLAEKLSLAFDMRSKEVAAGLHGWDATTQSLRVAILDDIAGAIRQLHPNVITFHKACASCVDLPNMRSSTVCQRCTRNWNHADHWREGTAQTANNSITGGR